MFKFSSVPAYSFGKRKDRLNPSDIPGPGQYNQSSKFGKKGGIMGKAPRGINYKSEAPGPGAYDPQDVSKERKK